LNTPRGLPVDVPETAAEDPSPKFALDDAEGIAAYYETNGYVIVKGLFPADCFKTVRGLWDSDVKPYRGYMYRQATAKLETHSFNSNGWVMNPILNIQSLDPTHFRKFRDYVTTNVLTSKRLSQAFRILLGDSPKVVQSMYFEGNSATWEHQDSYYLDSENIGEMAAAWIAVEDIAPTAGRFFICPGSHRIKLDDHSLYNNIAENHDAYIASVVAKIKAEKLEIRAPVMNQGDVLFWNALTIHGSLDSQDTKYSRSSITCHAIPRARKFLQLQTRVMDLKTTEINGTYVFRPKDLSSGRNKAIFLLESRFPKPFYWLKKQAILYMIKHKAA
jgi:phytanoyl-CoA hydroxylase